MRRTFVFPVGASSPAAVTVRMLLCVTASLAINELVGETGGLPNFYSNLQYPILLYAAMTLPLAPALVVALLAAGGLSFDGLLILDAGGGAEVVLRPLSMLAVAVVAFVVSRALHENLLRSDRMFRAIAENFPGGTMTVYDRDMTCVFAAGAGLTDIHLRRSDLEGHHPSEFIPPAVLAELMTSVERCFSGEAQTKEVELAGRTRRLNAVPLRLGARGITHVLVIAHDVTDIRATESALRESESRLAQFLENLPVGVGIMDDKGQPTYANKLADEILGRGVATGLATDELPEAYQLYKSGTDEPYPIEPMMRVLAGEAMVLDDMEVRTAEGTRALQMYIAPIFNAAGKVTNAISAFMDMTALRNAEAEIRHMAYRDPLTGLPNRRLLYERMEHDIAFTRRRGLPLAIVSLDLDGFKTVNDTYGHATGDELLWIVSGRLKSALRDSDTVARVGGDEFIVVLPQTDRALAQECAERLTAAVEQPIQLGDHSVTPRISFGIAVFEPGATADQVMSAADQEMYRSKEARRKTVGRLLVREG